MIDFLRANPWCSREEYMWEMTIPQIKLASIDFSHVEYLSEKTKSNRHKDDPVINNGDDLKNLNDLGIPII